MGCGRPVNIFMVHTGIKNLKKKPFGGAYSIHDAETLRCKNEAIQEYIKKESHLDPDQVKNDYLTKFKDTSSSMNSATHTEQQRPSHSST